MVHARQYFATKASTMRFVIGTLSKVSVLEIGRNKVTNEGLGLGQTSEGLEECCKDKIIM